jgi:DNA-binding NtrC family response regulator
MIIETGALEDEAALRKILGTVLPAEPVLAPSMFSHMSFKAPFVPLEDMERTYILSVLTHARGNKTEAARILGIERKTLARKLKRTEGSEVDDPEGDEP